MSWAPVRLALMGMNPMRAYNAALQETLQFPDVDGANQD
jgi:hypothetical protein